MFYYETCILCNFGFVWQNERAGEGARRDIPTKNLSTMSISLHPTPKRRIILKTFKFEVNNNITICKN